MEIGNKNKEKDFERLIFLVRKWENGETTQSEEDEMEEISLLLSESGDRRIDGEPALQLFFELRSLGTTMNGSTGAVISDDDLDLFFNNEIKKVVASERSGIAGKLRKFRFPIATVAAVLALVLGGFALIAVFSEKKADGIAALQSNSDEEYLKISEEKQLGMIDRQKTEFGVSVNLDEKGAAPSGKVEKMRSTLKPSNLRIESGKKGKRGLGVGNMPTEEEIEQVLAYVSHDIRSNFPVALDGNGSERENPLRDINYYDMAMADADGNIENLNSIWGNILEQINADWDMTFGDIGQFFSSFSEDFVDDEFEDDPSEEDE